ncbi:mitochondrial 39-S ribosomal protein L47 (MRP-L47)-domain-containing protein [Elsinoe ampelina]|uniref:Large ribosomal subunit protein uL29m n=1 Tax=Elsinoe ampelina TaxID=302913 RepID=A0A6A6GM59_9PEZI|nr:mitochondrial 39-S ribosomal protein L47 (MRP-L47)-domain-containing protein [Elsinoe ampelina]
MATSSRSLLLGGQSWTRAQSLPPPFLLPSLYHPQVRSFSSSPVTQKRESNKKRGLSALRRTGLRKGQTLSVKLANLPRPVLDPKKRSRIAVDPDHGLYKFFRSTEVSMTTPEELGKYGRAWTVEELRKKGWEDLHRLWWACVQERNLIATEEEERRRTEAGYGELEASDRDDAVKKTMRAIKHTLTERWYTWQNAREIAKQDPEIRLEPGAEKVYLTDQELSELQNQEYAYEDEAWTESSDSLLEEDAVPVGQIEGPEAGEQTSSLQAGEAQVVDVSATSAPEQTSEGRADASQAEQGKKKSTFSQLWRGKS